MVVMFEPRALYLSGKSLPLSYPSSSFSLYLGTDFPQGLARYFELSCFVPVFVAGFSEVDC